MILHILLGKLKRKKKTEGDYSWNGLK